jgi:hypothetical protein
MNIKPQRLPDESFADYKARQKAVANYIKQHLRGMLCHRSVDYTKRGVTYVNPASNKGGASQSL